MCWNITVLHLCYENCSCFWKVKILFTEYAHPTKLVRVRDERTFKRGSLLNIMPMKVSMFQKKNWSLYYYPSLHRLQLEEMRSKLCVSQLLITFWDCLVLFKFLLFFSDRLSRNNCIRLTTNLQLDIYENFTFFRSLLRWKRKKEEKGAGEGEVSAQRGTHWYSKSKLPKLRELRDNLSCCEMN